MPRTARVLVDGGAYHVLMRANNDHPLFHEPWDYQRYFQMLSTYVRDYELTLYHFVLMPNHIHLVLEIGVARALSKAMQGLSLAYASFYRRRHRYSGHLWQGRFKSVLVDRDNQLLACGRFVELNPIRANLVKQAGDYAWSSYRVYAEGLSYPLVTLNPFYETLGATPKERQIRYRQFIEERARQPHSERFDSFGFPAMRKSRGRPKKAEVAAS